MNRSVYGVIIPETISLLCAVKAYPSKISFQWKFKSQSNSTHLITFNDTLYAPRYMCTSTCTL